MPKAGVLSETAPGNVSTNKESPPKATEDAQKHKRYEFQKMPGSVELHVEKDQSGVAKGINGAKGECCDQSSEERTPHSLQREVVADLKKRCMRNMVTVRC